MEGQSTSNSFLEPGESMEQGAAESGQQQDETSQEEAGATEYDDGAKKPKLVERLKLIGGGIIVLSAFAIMMPGVLDYVGRIGRVALLVLLALSGAFVLVWVTRKLMGGRQKTS